MQFSQGHKDLNKNYRVKGMSGIETIVTILQDLGDSYSILMTSHSQLGTSESEELMSKDLFTSCLRTGYLEELPIRQLTIA